MSKSNFVILRYVIGGFIFGLLFPVGAIAFDLIRMGLSFSINNIVSLHEIVPIHYVVDSAPFVLCGVAYFIGKVAYRDQVRLRKAYERLNYSNNQLEESVSYSKLVQDAVLLRNQSIRKAFHSAYVHCKARDVVGGDYIWHRNSETLNGIGLVDCVGHGISGAMMTLVSNFLVQEICSSNKKLMLEDFFIQLDEKVQDIFGKTGLRNGMDFSMICFDKDSSNVTFAGANQALIWIKENGEVEMVKGVRRSIGESLHKKREFVSHTLGVSKGDKFMLYSDGLVDQFNELDNKKFGRKKLLSIVEECKHVTAKALGEKVLMEWTAWKGKNSQTDDNSFVVVEL